MTEPEPANAVEPLPPEQTYGGEAKLCFHDVLWRMIGHWMTCYSLSRSAKRAGASFQECEEYRKAQYDARRDLRLVLGEFGPPIGDSESLEDWLERGAKLLPPNTTIEIREATEDKDDVEEDAEAKANARWKRGQVA